ncbi:MAG: beta-N-acetylhexosaminidase [Deltaproteobacteria bacterium]|nr:beta-N-acetylhexosaminidase [Deltaproteobacteria bacterium]
MTLMSKRELHDVVGQLLIGGFAGYDIPTQLARLVEKGVLGGVILFARNIESVEGVANLLRRLAALSTPNEKLMFAVDQEGGRVQRLRKPFPELPPMRWLGQRAEAPLAHEAGRLLGACLRRIGFHQDYAPVLDVDSNPDNPVIGDRAFSNDADEVGRLGVAFIAGLQSEGVAACAKHFPGHGDTSTDSHLELPVLPHTWSRLEALELKPFAESVKADVASIMTAHILFPDLDPDLPATLSPRLLRPVLREKLGYAGVIVSDDLEMKAISARWGIGEAAVRAIDAGCDQLLICHHLERLEEAHEALIHAVESGQLATSRVREAAERVARLKARYVNRASECSVPEALAYLEAQQHRVSGFGETLERLAGLAGAPANDPTEPRIS